VNDGVEVNWMLEIRILAKKMRGGGQVLWDVMDNSRFQTNGLNKCWWFESTEDAYLDQMFWFVPAGALNYVCPCAGQVRMVS
jgi:hypothetical protein